MNKSILQSALLSLAVTAASGCAQFGHKQTIDSTVDVTDVDGNKHAPSKTRTDFSQSLQCMNRLLVDYNIPTSSISIVQSESHSGEVSGLYDMLLVALSTISGHNKKIAIVSGSNIYHELHQNPDYGDPQYFIRIGTPQLDTSVVVSRKSGGFNLRPLFSNRSDTSTSLSTISVDLTLGTVSNLQLVPGVFSNNRIVISNQHSNTTLSADVSLQSSEYDNFDDVGGESFGEESFSSEGFEDGLVFEDSLNAGDGGGITDSIITALGASLKINVSRKNGKHQAVRTLIELGALEIVGKYTKTPYWECLDIPATSPQVKPILVDWYNSMTDEERISYVLQQLGAMDNEIDVTGENSHNTAAAIARYQVNNDLIATGRVDFDLYYHLITHYDPDSLVSSVINRAESQIMLPIEIFPMSGAAQLYKENELVRVNFRTRAARYVYCYFEQSGGELFQLFPNPDHQSALVNANQTYPLTSDTVKILADAQDPPEKIFCYARDDKKKRSGKYTSLSYSQLTATIDELHAWHKQPTRTVPFYQEYKILID